MKLSTHTSTGTTTITNTPSATNASTDLRSESSPLPLPQSSLLLIQDVTHPSNSTSSGTAELDDSIRRTCRRPLVDVSLIHAKVMESIITPAAAPICIITRSSSTTPPQQRPVHLEVSSQNPTCREDRYRYSLLSQHRSVMTTVLLLLWSVATILHTVVPFHPYPYHRFVLLSNAFVVRSLPKTISITATTNLFVSHDFTRSASASSSSKTRGTSSSSSSSSSPPSPSTSSSAPSIITQAGFRPKTERLGLRKRLRSVLENAKRRGGFSSSTSSSSFSTSLSMSKNTTHNDASLIVAEAASIGGLYESVDFVLVNNNSYDSNKSKGKNGTGTDVISSIAPLSNGAKASAGSGMTSAPPNRNVVNSSGAGNVATIPELQKNGRKHDSVAIKENDRTVTLTPKVNGSSNLNGSAINGNSSSATKSNATSKNQVQVDAILNSGTVAPLPFRLPKLTREQKMKLMAGERIQEQSKMGRDGSGYVVLDVKAPDFVVWECLLDFEKYPEYIGTVRSMQMFTNTHLKQSYIAEKPVLPGTGRETRHYGTASITRASFVLSKFLLKIAAIHKYRPHPAGHYMEFTLDKACRNVVLKDAKGIWYTECNPDGRQGYTRIWLLCELSVSRVLPTFIVDYAAKRAMPRASNWIQPVVERVKKEFNIVD